MRLRGMSGSVRMHIVPGHHVAGCGWTGQVAPGRDTDRGCKSDARPPCLFPMVLQDGGCLVRFTT